MYHNQEAQVNFSKNGSTHIKQAPSKGISGDDREPISYKAYIDSPAWIEMRLKSSHIWGNDCLCCKSNKNIERHHIFYRKHIEEASPSEIIPLCRACHEAAHLDGDNKNGHPSDIDALKSILNRLFYKIVRSRNLSTSLIGKSHRAFWKVFGKYKKALFSKKKVRIQNVKTVYTQEDREKIFGKRKKKTKRKHGFFRADGGESEKKGGINTWACYGDKSAHSKKWATIR